MAAVTLVKWNANGVHQNFAPAADTAEVNSLASTDNATALDINIPVSAGALTHVLALKVDNNIGISVGAVGDGAGGVGARTLTFGSSVAGVSTDIINQHTLTTWLATKAITAGNYEIGRDIASSFGFNIPAGAAYHWYIDGGTARMTVQDGNIIFRDSTNTYGSDLDKNGALHLGTGGAAVTFLSCGAFSFGSYGVANFLTNRNTGYETLILKGVASQTVPQFRIQDSSSVNHFVVDGTVSVSGAPIDMTLTVPAHTGGTTTANWPSVLLDFSAIKTRAAGAVPLHYDSWIKASTLAFASGSNAVTTAATWYIDNAPTAGANCSGITYPWALQINAGASRFGGATNRAVGTPTASAGDLTLPRDGDIISITAANTINAITTTGWVAGKEFILIFAGAPLVKHNTAGGAGTAKIFLAGSADFQAAANSTLYLVYDGTQWQEIARKAA